MLTQQILLRSSRLVTRHALYHNRTANRSKIERIKRSYETKPETLKSTPRGITLTQSMREFFMHPLTWDRNNGYLNILLGLAIFGFCFSASCSKEQKSSKITTAPRKY